MPERVSSHNKGVPHQGVKEHAFFFKSIEDATALRQRVCECFERAVLPDTSEEVGGPCMPSFF